MNVLLVRTSALGDVVHTLPVLAALRRAWPAARLGWVVEETFAPLLAGHPALDRVIPVRLRAWRRQALAAATRRELAAAVAAMRSFRPDLTLDLMGNWKGATLARLSGAPQRRGARREDRREPSSALLIDQPVALTGTHTVERTLSLLPDGVAAAPIDFAGGGIAAEPMPQAAGAVLVQAGAGWGNKQWPAARWGAVAAALAERGWPVAVLAGPGEEALAGEVVAASGGAAALLAPGPLPRLVGALRAARLVLGGDTGPLHLAHALGTPVRMLLGPTDPARHGPWGAPQATLAHLLPCSFCYRRFGETKACLLEIPVEAVVAAATAALAPPGG